MAEADARLYETMRRLAPRAQALRENLQAFIDSLPHDYNTALLEGVLLGLSVAADSGREITEESAGYVTGIMAEVMRSLPAKVSA